MKQSIFLKIFFYFFAIIIALSALITVFSFRAIRLNYIDILQERLKTTGHVLIPRVQGFVNIKDFSGLEKYVIETEKKTGDRITVVDINGRVLADSENNPDKMENHMERPEIQEALKNISKGGFGHSIRYSNTAKKDMLYFAMLFNDSKGNKEGFIRLSMSADRVNGLIANLTGKIINLTLFILAVSVIMMAFAAKKISRPVKDLENATRKMSEGDFDALVNIQSGDELQKMGDDFNHMAGRVKMLFSELSTQKEELNTVITSIKEGLLVTDEKGKIQLANDSFKTILKNTGFSGAAEGKSYWEIMLSPGFNALIEKVLKEKTALSEQLEINGRVYLAGANYLKETSGAVLILHDVTGIREFEEMKKDFVANVSHELKTPLTAIKGFAETLEAETEEESGKKYLGIIIKHTDRLVNIVEDLLSLSKLEAKGHGVSFEKTNLKEAALSAVKIFEKKAAQKGIALGVDIKENDFYAKADPIMAEQALINLIDNAVKYTDSGSVTVSAARENNQILISVTDTGCSIPKESLPRLFERFYTVDRSRSRKLGGTGLGLSIVKHIMMVHGGDVTAASEAGKGSVFTLYFPSF
ncbi:MAG: Alkaline phosphatase synthesis sensor protein PhoR [Candidatus Aerophobetes bacterium ADurb.Bin490]|nr:MAG: Alkaline phosphatase synthesis sensor protein PhoR [Candidatus Aerophobetes bacterium ADurb.Bin490]HPN63665.1 ATP-binding protein [Candidatus Goldiibacteriota bacterium]HRQ44047.1 ATP-binding protein [Candidatus Goldiibacteriota bacterium]